MVTQNLKILQQMLALYALKGSVLVVLHIQKNHQKKSNEQLQLQWTPGIYKWKIQCKISGLTKLAGI